MAPPSPRRLAFRRLFPSAMVLVLASLAACSDADRELGPSVPEPTVPESTEPPVANASSPPTYLQPASMRVLTSNDWAGFSVNAPSLRATLSGWYRYLGGNTGKTVIDASAGCGSSATLEVTFPQGSRQGTGPEHLALGTGSGWLAQQGTFRQLYLRYCVWVPSNYYGSGNGVQKLFHVWGTTDGAAAGNTTAVPSIYGVGNGALAHQLRLQNMSTKNGGKVSFNLGCTSAARGRWDRVEILLTQNTGGQANGQAQMWVNGTSCRRVTNLTWSGSARTLKRWTAVQLNPTYGGSGTVATTQRIRYGAVRVAGQ